MTRKMMTVQRIGGIGIGLLFAGACGRSYLAPGLRGESDLSGSYIVQAQPVANRCSEVTGEQVRSRLDVQHLPGEVELTLVFEGDAYPAKMRRDGKFASTAVRRIRGGAAENATMRGRFRDSTITASLEVNRGAVRPVLPTSQTHTAAACGYHVNISGNRIAEPRTISGRSSKRF